MWSYIENCFLHINIIFYLFIQKYLFKQQSLNKQKINLKCIFYTNIQVYIVSDY